MRSPAQATHQTQDMTVDQDANVPVSVSLGSLQRAEQRELLDLVGKLRELGLNSVLSLPQIVVCGDQSAGKSSVLEALTEIPFPQKEGLCTRFATEIVMRRDARASVTCTLVPGADRTLEDQASFRSFSRSIVDFNELPDIIEECTQAMGLGDGKAFSKDVLRIEICGPQRPHLTLVDLPGMVHSPTKSHSEEDVELIKQIVRDYISRKRTIILAIVSAKNDYANQVILKFCRDFDAKGSRTLGIITKCDWMLPDTEGQSAWLRLAKNQDVHLELGWHLIRNRGEKQSKLSFSERNRQENDFFGQGAFEPLSPKMKGVATLRDRLSMLLFDHLRSELPALKDELQTMLGKNARSLASLGKSRANSAERRIFLTELSIEVTDTLRKAIGGNYDGPFFGGIDLELPVTGQRNVQRLRAVVQHLNLNFAENMHKNGQAFKVVEDQSADKPHNDDEEGGSGLSVDRSKARTAGFQPICISRAKMLRKIMMTVERLRGRELPGMFNPMIIGELFQEQSCRWEYIARDHLQKVLAACEQVVLCVIDTVMTDFETKPRLVTSIVTPALQQMSVCALQELDKILTDQGRHAIAYNHYFTDNYQKAQQDQFHSQIKPIIQQATTIIKEHHSRNQYGEQQHIDPAQFESLYTRKIQRDMPKFAAQQVLDAHNAFYKTEKKYFIDVVTKQVIERHLAAPLADILSPRLFARLSDEEIAAFATESEEAICQRSELSARQEMLEQGRRAFMAITGFN